MALKRTSGGDFAPSWKPQDGESVEGIVVGFGENTNDWGKYPIVTLRVIEDNQLTGNEVAIHGASKILRDFIEGADDNPALALGDHVRVTSDGRKTSKKGASYDAYTTEYEAAADVESHLKATPTPQGAADPADDEPW